MKATVTTNGIVTRGSAGRPVANSRDVARYFGKEHKNVLRDIDNILADTHGSILSGVQFQEVSSPHPTVKGRSDRAYLMDRDGFTLLAMGFTGPKALHASAC